MSISNLPYVLWLKRTVGRYPAIRSVVEPILFPRRVFRSKWFSREYFEQTQGNLFAQPPVLSVPEFEGEFRVGARSHILTRLLLEGEYEPQLAALCKRLIDPARDVIDIGGNIGFYSVLAAKSTNGRVVVVEPTDAALGLLKENLERNGVLEKAIVVEGVVSDSAGEARLNVIAGQEEYSSLGAMVHPSVRGTPNSQKSVTSYTLDDLVRMQGIDPGFVKIDVEGAEFQVLSGAVTTISEKRPIVLCEFSLPLLLANGVEPGKLLEFFRERDYRLIDPSRPSVPLGKRNFADLLAVPEETLTEAELAAEIAEIHRLAGRAANQGGRQRC